MTTGHIPEYNAQVHLYPEYGTITHSRYSDRQWAGMDGRNNWCNEYSLVHSQGNGGGILIDVIAPNSGINDWQPYGAQTIDPYPDVSDDFSDNDVIECINKLAENVQGHKLNPSQAYAELDKSALSIGNAAAKFGNYLKLLGQGRYKDALRVLKSDVLPVPSTSGLSRQTQLYTPKQSLRNVIVPSVEEIASKHLSYVYEWSPILSDVHNAAEAFAAATHFSRTERVTALVSREYKTSAESSARSSKTSVKLITDITTAFENPLPTYDNIDPLQVAWERVPLSFVFDWFVPVSNMLQAKANISTMGGLIMKCRKSRTTSDRWAEPIKMYENGVGWKQTLVGSCNRKTYHFQRHLLDQTAFGIAAMLSFNGRFSKAHALNGTALVFAQKNLFKRF